MRHVLVFVAYDVCVSAYLLASVIVKDLVSFYDRKTCTNLTPAEHEK